MLWYKHNQQDHQRNLDRALILAAKRQNIPAIVVGFKDCEERVMSELPVLRHFEIHPYAKPDIRMTAEEDFSMLNEIFLHCLMKLPFELTKQDVVLFPTVNQNQLLAIPAWMMRLMGEKGCPQVVVGLMFGPKWISWTEKDSDQPVLYSRAFKSWPAAVRKRIRIVCESDGLGREYGPCRPRG